ncbi:hypothetical protein ACQR1W_31465 [Bradyrhizobium sp. HKCCYLS1011]|uniref:hypothetical protein n=1 Tax=Bradyrhizobium sp. HKCCYLS1011 TaxID=3420733 RepID=UPI003EBE35ED
MDDAKRHYRLHADTGHIKVVEGSASPVVNTAIVAASSLTSLGHDFVVVPPLDPNSFLDPDSVLIQNRTSLGDDAPSSQTAQKPESVGRRRTTAAASDPTKSPGAIAVSAGFTLIFGAVFAITVFGFVAEIFMAIFWTGTLTSLQQSVTSSADWAFKAGLGAILGLLGGKTVKK